MKRASIIAVLIAAGCGSVDERRACGSSLECPAGEWCAAAEGERRCWPDATAPVVSAVTASCTTAPCLRDGTLHVEATAADDNEVLDASVTLSLDASQSVTMTRSGSKWIADVPLRQFPFGAFDGQVVASVTARDGAKTSSAAVSAAGAAVTRLRWTYDAGVPMTPAAVMDDGTAVVGLARATDQLLAVSPHGQKAWSLSVGVASLTGAPAVGDLAIWVGSNDGVLRAVALDGSAPIANVGVDTGGSIDGGVSVVPGSEKEWGFVASRSGRVGAASTVANEDNFTADLGSFTAGPVTGVDAKVFAATDSLTAEMRCFGFDGAFTGDQCVIPGNPSLGANVLLPLAIDAAGNVWTASNDGGLARTTVVGDTLIVKTLPDSFTSAPLVLANGDVVVGDQGGNLHRITPTGAVVWSAEPNLGAAVTSPVVLRDGPALLLVPTEGGEVYAINSDGTIAWSATLGAGPALRAPNIYTPPGQTGAVMSTAYVPGADGKLYAIVVDGQLDTSAPWPKAFHDPRNTNNAGTQP